MSCKHGAGFYQYETADLEITLEKDQVFVDAKDVVVSIVQGSTRIDYHADQLDIDTETNTILMHITQEDAGMFGNSSAVVQVNVLYEDGERDVSAQGTISIFANLFKEVME